MKTKYHFNVPDQKRVRMIVHTDCKNEADDQYALVHHLLTPKFIVRGIVAGHFDLHSFLAERRDLGARRQSSHRRVPGRSEQCGFL